MQKILVPLFIAIMLVGIGTIYYHNYEGWNWIDSAYFSTMTLSTIGYGDLHPTHSYTKLFTIFYVFIGVSLFLYSLSRLAEFNKPHVEKKVVEPIVRKIIEGMKNGTTTSPPGMERPGEGTGK